MRADACFDEACVEFEVWLAESGVHENFSPTPQAHTKRSGDYGTLAEFDGLRHRLKLLRHHFNLIPFFVLNGEKQLHEVGTDREIRRIAGDDEAVEIPDCIAVRLQIFAQEGDDILAERVHL